MFNRKNVGLRVLVLGAAAAGLMSPAIPAMGLIKAAAAANSKRTAAKPIPVQSTQPPKLLAVPDTSDTTAYEIQTVSQNDATGGKSEVQKQLDLLFQQNGRETQDMSMNLQPINPSTMSPAPATAPGVVPSQSLAQPNQKPANPAPGHRQYQPATASRPQATPYPSQPPRNISAAVETHAVAPQQLQQQTQPQPRPSQQPPKNSVAGFFKKITGGNKSPAPLNPVPPDYANNIPQVPPASMAAAMPAPVVQNPSLNRPPQTLPPNRTMPAARPMVQPQLASNQQPFNSNPQQVNVTATAGSSIDLSQPPQPSSGLPTLSEKPVPLQIAVTEDSLPPLKNLGQPPAITNASTKPATKVAVTVRDSSNDFPNPFPDQPETIASAPTAKATLERAPDLQVEAQPSKEAVTSTLVNDSPNTDEDPYAVRTKDFAEPSIDERDEAVSKAEPRSADANQVAAPAELTESKSAIQEMIAPPSLSPVENDSTSLTPPGLTPPANESAANAAERVPAAKNPNSSNVAMPDAGETQESDEPSESQLDKTRRIRDRFGMKGLKGFCPVTLRDDRELLDARPEFNSSHRGQKFHFASEEARLRFIADPILYIPAAYGADVVALTRDKDIVEGTLDYASWFKGRLYLFATQSNYSAFIKSPAKYATPASIE